MDDVTQCSAVATRFGAIIVPVQAMPSLLVRFVLTYTAASSAATEASPLTIACSSEPKASSSADWPQAAVARRVERRRKDRCMSWFCWRA
jgi:hypothetical protein